MRKIDIIPVLLQVVQVGGNDFKKRKNISSVVDAIRKDRYIQKHTEESLIQADKM